MHAAVCQIWNMKHKQSAKTEMMLICQKLFNKNREITYSKHIFGGF